MRRTYYRHPALRAMAHARDAAPALTHFIGAQLREHRIIAHEHDATGDAVIVVEPIVPSSSVECALDSIIESEECSALLAMLGGS